MARGEGRYRCGEGHGRNVGQRMLVRKVVEHADHFASLRAPFTEFEESGGPSEFEESARGDGARKAVGELLVCPYCLGLWVVSAFSLGLVFAPRLTRFLAAVFSALTISDFLQIAYKAAEEKGLG